MSWVDINDHMGASGNSGSKNHPPNKKKSDASNAHVARRQAQEVCGVRVGAKTGSLLSLV